MHVRHANAGVRAYQTTARHVALLSGDLPSVYTAMDLRAASDNAHPFLMMVDWLMMAN